MKENKLVLEMLLKNKEITRQDIAKIVGCSLGTISEGFEAQHVCLAQVGDMDVVTDAGTVGGGIIAAKHLNAGAAPQSRKQCERDHMRFRRMILSEFPFGISSGGAKIAQ